MDKLAGQIILSEDIPCLVVYYFLFRKSSTKYMVAFYLGITSNNSWLGVQFKS